MVRSTSRVSIYSHPRILNLLYSVLADKVFESIDGDLWLPRLGMLQDFESFGWLRFTFEELEGGPVESSGETRASYH